MDRRTRKSKESVGKFRSKWIHKGLPKKQEEGKGENQELDIISILNRVKLNR